MAFQKAFGVSCPPIFPPLRFPMCPSYSRSPSLEDPFIPY